MKRLIALELIHLGVNRNRDVSGSRRAGLLFVLFVLTGVANAASMTVIVDDYGPYEDPEGWYHTRIGTDRGAMGSGDYDVALGQGSAQVEVRSGWAGVWTSVKHTAAERQVPDDTLDPVRILGPYVLDQWQPALVGIEVDLTAGSGLLKVELKDANDLLLYQATQAITGAGTLVFDLPAGFDKQIKLLNWIVDGGGAATVSQVRLRLVGPDTNWQQKAFLYSYGHMSQAYDEESGLIRDRARSPAEDFSAVPVTGTFSLATVVARDLGYVSDADAVAIAERAQNALLALPTCNGVLPHFVELDSTAGVWQIVEGTEWSTIDTAIGIVSLILAREALGLDTQALVQKLSDIDWALLTSGGREAISHGYANDCSDIPLASRWDTFGSESFIIGLAYTAATGGIPLLTNPTPPTWDGSGFNDELAALFFPMTGIDYLGNDWRAFRTSAFENQHVYFQEADSLYLPYAALDLFSVSASEVPEPWKVDQDYGAWGVGGITATNDGRHVVGYPILAPHYAAMVAAEHPVEAGVIFDFLEETTGTLSPLNNTESFGIDGDGTLRWNSLKGSWNLSLQTLGMARALSTQSYLPYKALRDNGFLVTAFDALMTFTPLGAVLPVAASLPSSRSVQLGSIATAFATIINTDTITATGCSIAPLTSVPAGFSYQTTDPATNVLIGTPDTPVDIAGGGMQTYLFAFTPTEEIAPTDVQLSYECTNSDPAPVIVGLNTLLLSASEDPVPDIVALGTTPSMDGIVNIPGSTGTGVFSVATVNVGIGAEISVSADTGGANLPVILAQCETDPVSGLCINPMVPTSDLVLTAIGAGETPTFAFFVTASGEVPFNPANNRVFVRFKDSAAIVRGATSVTVRTQ